MAIRVALLGTKFMGKAHSQAYRNVNMFFPDSPKVEMKVIVRSEERRVGKECRL